jgi:hypothetical protein
MKSFLAILSLIISAMIILSCDKEKDENFIEHLEFDSTYILSAKDFLFNIPINGDTIFIDESYGIDFRIDLEGYKIESVVITIDSVRVREFNINIINTGYFGFYNEGIHKIKFELRVEDLDNGNKISLNSGKFVLKVLENLSNKFISTSEVDGRLCVVWPQLDIKNTQYYLIERIMGDNNEYVQEIESKDFIFIDHYYVGERVDYKISVINNEGERQNIWYYHKELENPNYIVTQKSEGGYSIHFNRCKYYNNFGQYYLTTGMNDNPEFLYSSTSISDTIYNDPDLKFADEVRYWLRYYPKEFPESITAENWELYGHFLYAYAGELSFKYDIIAIIDENNVVYTWEGKIYKRNLETNQITDSIINRNVYYRSIRTTPSGKYFYSIDYNLYGSPLYFWSSDTISNSPRYTFQNNFSVVAKVSDNLIAIMDIQGGVDNSKWGLYDVTNGNLIFPTPYFAYDSYPTISSNGEYLLIGRPDLRLCHYSDSILTVLWENTDWSLIFNYIDFNPNNSQLYIWDDLKNFVIMSTSNISDITSYTLDVEQIINIDLNGGKIMGFQPDKIIIYNLVNGQFEKEIPANISNLFTSGNNGLLLGNTIYSNWGVKYKILN